MPVHEAAGRARSAAAGWGVIAPFLIATVLLAALGVLSADLLSAARAYVGGESLWSKARVSSTRHLREYLYSGDAAALEAFERALSVPLGDRIARIALERTDTDMAVVREGFIQGGNHPDDIPGMARLYIHFGNVPAIARAIEIWAAADDEIVRVKALANEAAQAGPPLDPARRASMLLRLDAIDQKLAAYEIAFSARLGEASRLSTSIVVAATLALALVLSALAGLLAHRSLRRMAASEAAERRSNARWQMAARAAGIGIFEWQIDARWVDVDRRCLELHGLPGGSPRRQAASALLECIHPDDRARVIESNRAGIAGDALWQVRYRARHADGGLRHVELSARRSVDAPVVVGMVRDVTDDEQAARLRREKEAAEHASAAKSAFLSRASHELRTPLNAVLGFAQMMQLDQKDPLAPAQARRLDFVMQGGAHLLKLVNDLLDLSSAEQGEVGLTLCDVELGATLHSVAGLLEPLAQAHGIALHVYATGPLAVQADRTRLEQVLVNLVSNAIKYNRPGGQVWLLMTAQADAAHIEVRDDGIGMTAEQLRNLFQPFNRLGAERRGIEGVGLGLVVSRSLIERFGGRLEVESEPRVGTTMHVYLRRAADAGP